MRAVKSHPGTVLNTIRGIKSYCTSSNSREIWNRTSNNSGKDSFPVRGKTDMMEHDNYMWNVQPPSGDTLSHDPLQLRFQEPLKKVPLCQMSHEKTMAQTRPERVGSAHFHPTDQPITGLIIVCVALCGRGAAGVHRMCSFETHTYSAERKMMMIKRRQMPLSASQRTRAGGVNGCAAAL